MPYPRYLAEFIGTFILVFAGTAAIVVNDITGALTHLGVALVFGLAVTTMIYTFGDISGAHINPAVTLALWRAGRFPGREVAPYIVSQCAGALCASLLVRWLFPGHGTLGATLPALPAAQVFALETLLTFILMLTIINAATAGKEKGIMAGVAVGAVVMIEALFAGPLTGASMNPARSLAPALIGEHGAGLWIYLAAPCLGAYLAIPCCRGLREKECCP